MRVKLHRGAALIAAVATVAGAAPVATATAAGVTDGARSSSCTKARIGGKTVCLKAGLSCKRKYQKQYLKNGFSCAKRDSKGRYHLKTSQSF